jgi:hypothetical protein
MAICKVLSQEEIIDWKRAVVEAFAEESEKSLG